MKDKLRIRIFAHSFVSDWNHGNAHFLRGLARELVAMGHEVRCFEELGAWSLANLVRHEPEVANAAIEQFRAEFPMLDVRFYQKGETLESFLACELQGADIVLIHEWNEPGLVNRILDLKSTYGFRALFHDTHHRAYTNPGEIQKFRLTDFDGVLSFGEAITRIYREAFGVRRVWTFHEAADTVNFHPASAGKKDDVLWIGNWGDEERTAELMEFLVAPATQLPGARVAVHGVRYPASALETLSRAGVEYRGYLPNLMAPDAYSQARVALHVPRRHYANGLSGVPTIRVFEALACGAPLLCAPWVDAEQLFRTGEDYLCVPEGRAMTAELGHLLNDERACRQLAENGQKTIQNRHTCRHRAQQLEEICREISH